MPLLTIGQYPILQLLPLRIHGQPIRIGRCLVLAFLAPNFQVHHQPVRSLGNAVMEIQATRNRVSVDPA